MQPVIDNEFLKQYQEFDDTDILQELVNRFSKGAPTRIAAIRLAIENRDAKTLEFESHTFKNQCANVGATVMAETCAALEDMGEDEHFENSLGLQKKLAHDLPIVLDALKRYMIVHLVEKTPHM
jgi:HPt (histidine-containing phosphotransfer) domain-containing protein